MVPVRTRCRPATHLMVSRELAAGPRMHWALNVLTCLHSWRFLIREERRKFLDQLIGRELIYHAALREGMDRETAVQSDLREIEKEYLVRVQFMAQPEAENVMATTPPEAIEQLRFGLELDGKPLKPAQVSWQNEQQLRVVLREGRKRQIRRMCELVGLKVTGLKRVRIGQVRLGDLPLGQWRVLRAYEAF